MPSKRKVTSYLAVLNTLIGTSAFAGPLVTGNRDRFINIRPGFLFGIFAINWLHALVHLIVGLIGLPLRTDEVEARSYLKFHGVLFTLLSLMGWMTARKPGRMHHMMGMTINTPGTVVHTIWAVVGLWFGFLQPARTGGTRPGQISAQEELNSRQANH